MSRRYFDGQYEGRPVRLTLGYDRPLDQFFLQVEYRPADESEDASDDDSPYLYASIDDPDASTDDLEYFRAKLNEFGLHPPESVFLAVVEDAIERVGNVIAEHFADGRIMIRHGG